MRMEEMKSLLKKGLLQIFSANLINKVVQFGTVAALTHIIAKDDLGNFSYAQNIMSFALLLEGAGVTTGILQYCSVSKDDGEKATFFNFGLKFGIIFNVILFIAMLLYGNFAYLKMEGSRPYIIMLSCIPLFTVVFNSIQSYLRSLLKNKEFSILTTFNTIVYFIATVGLSLEMGAKGLAIGMYIAYITSIILGFWFIKDDIKKKPINNDFEMDKVAFLKYSIITVLTNAMSQILYLLDTQLVGAFSGDPVVLASYKTATTIPFNLTFIPASIMIFAYPYFAQNKDNKKWIADKVKKLTQGLLAVNLVIGIGCIVFSKLIISIVFGKQYLDAVACFNVLMVGYIIAGTFRVPYGNILASMGLVKCNLYNAIFSGIANIILDVVLILKFGSIGAAYATLIVFIISSIIHYIFLKRAMREA